MRRKWREIVINGTPRLVWRVLQMIDGRTTVAAVLAGLSEDDRSTSARLLSCLEAAGAIDVSGRSVAKFIHSATKKGMLPAGGLDNEGIMTLATDGNYRAYPGATRISLTPLIPDGLRPS
jgi:hypothetical protein